jgi:hypothetical protein
MAFSLPRAMLFDMDGTLTAPFLDFDLIKSEMGIGNAPILESIAQLEGAQRQAAVETGSLNPRLIPCCWRVEALKCPPPTLG